MPLFIFSRHQQSGNNSAINTNTVKRYSFNLIDEPEKKINVRHVRVSDEQSCIFTSMIIQQIEYVRMYVCLYTTISELCVSWRW